ncbi:GT-D fold domain-containing glycosyltransferase [Methanospirillum sp.]|uniref:GT-D fold domain-containing glycosyltransferase n=1 Tax=Methanospirillum sp. TaxID=45200 RepID=UPI0035A0D1AF
MTPKLRMREFENEKREEMLFILKSIIFNLIKSSGFDNIFYNAMQTINHLKNNKQSLIRWGDGETQILIGRSIKFQKRNNELQKYLYLILDEHSKENAPYLLAMPNYFLKKSKKQLVENEKYYIWRDTRYLFSQYSKKNQIYGDAFVFRPLSKLTNKDIEPLWLGKNVILVCSKKKYFDDFKERYHDQKIFNILIPESNAFEVFEEIVLKIKKIYFRNCLNKDDTRVLIAAGPAAKAIIYVLSKESIICYDMGHYFEWIFYNRTNFKGI